MITLRFDLWKGLLLIKFALGRDGCIYAISGEGQILKIDTTNNFHCFVGNSVKSDHEQFFQGRGDATLGIDGFIYQYSPPAYARRILKYDPHANKTSLVGEMTME